MGTSEPKRLALSAASRSSASRRRRSSARAASSASSSSLDPSALRQVRACEAR